jgi:hypothetical protein
MTQQQVMNQRAEPGQPDAPAAGDQLARQEAIKQIERRRRFWVRQPWAPSARSFWRSSGPSRNINAGGWPTALANGPLAAAIPGGKALP